VRSVSKEKSKELRARIISGSIVLLSGSSLATVINLAYNIAVARSLGPVGFGQATAVYTLLTILSAVTLSFQIVSTKLVALQTTESGKNSAYRVLHRGAWACGIAVALVLIAMQGPIASYLGLPNRLMVVFLAVGTAFYVALGSRRGYIQGAFGFRRLASNLVLEGAVRLFGSVLMILLHFGVTGVIGANAAAMAVAYFAIPPRRAPREESQLRFRYVVREIGQALIFFSGQVLINNCDIVLVKHYFVSQEAGLYAAIAMVGRVIFAFSSAVVNSMFPVVAGSQEEERRNFSLIITSLLLVLGVGSVFAIGLRVAPAWIWTKFFGPNFVLNGHYGFPYLLGLYAITTVIYSLSVVIITYEMSYKIANTSWLQLAFSGMLILALTHFHSSLRQVIVVQLILMVALLLIVAALFLRHALKKSGALMADPERSVRLLHRISEDDAIAEFIKSDFGDETYRKYHESLRDIVHDPRLDDQRETELRRALLFLRHYHLWRELPKDTEWYEVEVTPENLKQIRVFPRAHWRKLNGGNFDLFEVVERIRIRQLAMKDPFDTKIANLRHKLAQEVLNPGSIVLIGIDACSPMTVLDGNHRLVSAVIEGRIDRLTFICGLSPSMTQCCWYKTDFFNLTRYATHLVQYANRRPEAELNALL
jgi:O-antigen/teichoic acid export membrane protein